MFKKYWKSKWQRMIVGLCVGGLVMAGVVAVIPAAAAQAAPATPTAPSQQQGVRDARLEKAYQKEQAWLTKQQANLDKLNTVADRVQQFITTQQNKGKDVSALQAALATFKSQLTAAHASHQTAAKVLSAHLGFDANGKVMETAQARQTLVDARQALRDTCNVMRQAGHDLRSAVRQWRQTNGVKIGQPASTPSASAFLP